MSIRLMTAVWESSVEGVHKRMVLLALADSANDEGVCWPKMETLAQKTGMGLSTTRGWVARLEGEGLVTRENASRPLRKSNTYTIHIDRLPARDLAGTSEVPANSQAGTPAKSQAGHPANSQAGLYEPSVEPKEEPFLSLVADAPTDAEQERMDVEKLCSVLQASMVANGCKKPTITKAWRDEARRLLDRDERPLDQALAVLAWSQVDSFWKKNIQSIPKFREKYDRLRMAWEEAAPAGPVSGSESSIRDWLRAMWQEGTVAPVEERSGLRFPHPDLPAGIRSKDEAREFHLKARRDWITANADLIVRTILERAA